MSRRQKDPPRLLSAAALVALVCALAVAMALLESQSGILRDTYANVVLDNRYHRVPCERLPTPAEVEKVIEAHRETVQRIEQVHPGQVGLEAQSGECPGRADLTIWYASHQDRLAIEEIIGADTFFGVPYNLVNR